MYWVSATLHYLLPLIASLILLLGMRKNRIHFLIASLWISVIALILDFEASDGQIIGSYFNYTNVLLYTTNLLVLCCALIPVLLHLGVENTFVRSIGSLLGSIVVITSILVAVNLWINAYFIENRMLGTPVMQVAVFKKPNYCTYKHVFYTISKDGAVYYLCPHHYGLIPSIGRLSVNPDFIVSQLHRKSKE